MQLLPCIRTCREFECRATFEVFVFGGWFGLALDIKNEGFSVGFYVFGGTFGWANQLNGLEPARLKIDGYKTYCYTI